MHRDLAETRPMITPQSDLVTRRCIAQCNNSDHANAFCCASAAACTPYVAILTRDGAGDTLLAGQMGDPALKLHEIDSRRLRSQMTGVAIQAFTRVKALTAHALGSDV